MTKLDLIDIFSDHTSDSMIDSALRVIHIDGSRVELEKDEERLTFLLFSETYSSTFNLFWLLNVWRMMNNMTMMMSCWNFSITRISSMLVPSIRRWCGGSLDLSWCLTIPQSKFLLIVLYVEKHKVCHWCRSQRCWRWRWLTEPDIGSEALIVAMFFWIALKMGKMLTPFWNWKFLVRTYETVTSLLWSVSMSNMHVFVGSLPMYTMPCSACWDEHVGHGWLFLLTYCLCQCGRKSFFSAQQVDEASTGPC